MEKQSFMDYTKNNDIICVNIRTPERHGKNMAGNVAIGIQSFEDIIKGKYFYIDKTDFIKEWWDNGDSVTLITRPRRFGKTLNMSMIEQFFSLNYANRGDLFEKLSIWQHEEYRQIQGTYPVISMSFASVKEENYQKTREKICEILTKLFVKHSYLRDSDKLTKADKLFFDRMLEPEIRDTDATSALHQLSDYMQRYYGKKAIIILDEYDTPMQEAYVNGYWDELVSFTRSLFNSTFKTNPYMERALMTGITRVSKESIFSDFNNPEVVTVTSDKYATCFGFTQKEVFDALDKYGLSVEKEQVKAWYNGFIFGKHHDIYNPWSILNFIDKKEYATYWANTSGNRLVGKLIRESGRDVKQQFEQLLRGDNLRCPIDEQIVYNQLDESEASIWSLLLASGYLKVISYDRLDQLGWGQKACYEVALTNREVMSMFESMVNGWFMKVSEDYNDFIKAMLLNDVEAMNEFINQITCEIFSSFDTGRRVSNKAQPERFYHGFILGLMVDLKSDYVITSNRESGFGRYDVVLEPRDKSKNAYIFEFKVHKPLKENTLEETMENALKQIEEKQYETDLISRGIPKENIYKYGFAFRGKEVLIG